jgi:hypothetical protein
MAVMPVSAALRELSENPGFWTGAARLDRALRVSFPVAGGYGLVLDLDPHAGERALGLRGPAASEPIQLGYTAPGLPIPAALRWWELEMCARVIALDDPTLPHPGLVVALLSPFAPPMPDDDGPAITAVRTAAYRSLRNPAFAPAEPDPQPPLPLFTAEQWWPSPSPQLLDESTIADLIGATPATTDVRGGTRFPQAELDQMLGYADQRLSRLGQEPGYAAGRPLAREITASGDLGTVGALVNVLTEAGCDHPTVLDALSEPLVPVEACWMVETLAGAAPGTLLRHLV